MKGQLHHGMPPWVRPGERFHIRIRVASGAGCSLTTEVTASAVLDAARQYHGTGRWYLHRMVLMPDHLHAVISFPPAPGMSRTIASWKGYLRKNHSIHWQGNYFDHRLRNEDEFVEKMHYISMNPVRAGLAAKPGAWPWVLDAKMIGAMGGVRHPAERGKDAAERE